MKKQQNQAIDYNEEWKNNNIDVGMKQMFLLMIFFSNCILIFACFVLISCPSTCRMFYVFITSDMLYVYMHLKWTYFHICCQQNRFFIDIISFIIITSSLFNDENIKFNPLQFILFSQTTMEIICNHLDHRHQFGIRQVLFIITLHMCSFNEMGFL